MYPGRLPTHHTHQTEPLWGALPPPMRGHGRAKRIVSKRVPVPLICSGVWRERDVHGPEICIWVHAMVPFNYPSHWFAIRMLPRLTLTEQRRSPRRRPRAAPSVVPPNVPWGHRGSEGQPAPLSEGVDGGSFDTEFTLCAGRFAGGLAARRVCLRGVRGAPSPHVPWGHRGSEGQPAPPLRGWRRGSLGTEGRLCAG